MKHTNYIILKNSMLTISPEFKEDDINAGIVMLSALEVGANINKIHKYIDHKIPLKTIQKFGRNLTRNKIWKNGKTHCNWANKQTGTTEFICDIMVARGVLDRSK